VRRGAAWIAECHRGAAWLCSWPESRWQCLPPSSPGCRSPQAASASPNPWTASEIGQRRRAGRECQDACHAVRHWPVPTVWRPLSCPAVPVQPSGWPASIIQPPGVQAVGVQAVGVQAVGVQPSGVQPSGVSDLVSAASALSASRSAVGSVRPGAGDAGGGLSRPAGQYRLRSDRVSLGCGCGRARPDDRRGGQAVARIARRSRPSQCRKRAEHDVAHLPRGCAPMPSGAERA
jgi:hypothetical protein